MEIAANKGRTKWLQQLLRERLPLLNSSTINYNHWFDELIAFMVARGLVNPTQQKDYLTDVRNAIKALDPEHPALKIIRFDPNTWTEINNVYTDKLAERTTKFISNPDAIVQKASTLLSSYQWAEIAAGLAVVTGRRCTEVIQTAQFEEKTKYSVIFTGALKRKNEPVECVFEIPTLVAASTVIDAIQNLREQLAAQTAALSPRQINARFNRRVTQASDRAFGGLVPNRDDHDSLYTHLFRAVYSTIAAHWFCPPTVSQLEYRAYIQGHFQILDEQNPELRRSLAATRNYFDYQISDGAGNIDGRLGIKLHLPDVKVIEEFQSAGSPPPKPLKINTQIPVKSSAMNEQKTTSIPPFLLPRLEAMSSRWGLPQLEMIKLLFDCADVVDSISDELGFDKLDPLALYDHIQELKQQLESSQSTSLPTSNAPTPNPLDSKDQVISDLSTSLLFLTQTLSGQSQGFNLNSPDHSTNTLITQPVKPQTSQPTKSKKSQQVELSINRAIDAIIAFNNAPKRTHADKWQITVRSVRSLTGNGQGAIERVIKQRQSEIDQHHSTHQLAQHHNSKGKNAPSIDQVIPFN
jgi:hypothetical protein